jgi:hypothetical protein
MKISDAFYIHSYGVSKQPPHSSLETIRVPFGSKVPTDFDAPDVDEELYEDDVRAPDIGRFKFSFFAEKSRLYIICMDYLILGVCCTCFV